MRNRANSLGPVIMAAPEGVLICALRRAQFVEGALVTVAQRRRLGFALVVWWLDPPLTITQIGISLL